MRVNWNDDHLVALELAGARPGMAKLGGMLAAVVEDKLAPALANRRVHSCLHLVDEAVCEMGVGGTSESSRQMFLCPQHPYRLVCDAPAIENAWSGCVTSHYRAEHDDHTEGACFVCEAPLRDNFVFIFAEVELHRPVPIYDDNRGRGTWFTVTGTISTLPVAYLCPRHERLVDGPIRMSWPTTMAGLTVADLLE